MRISATVRNQGLVSLIEDHTQIITVDANILIPPDRRKENHRVPPISFSHFETYWINPILSVFPNLTVHEAVYEELQDSLIREYIQGQLRKVPSRFRVLKDSNFDDNEESYRAKLEQAISYYTAYDPMLDNKDDRGEVKSLAHIGTKGYLYFCSHDQNALRLVEQAKELETHLDNVNAIRTYEIIYFLYKLNIGDPKGLRMLYKYMYYLSAKDKMVNPRWNDFVRQMDMVYGKLFEEL